MGQEEQKTSREGANTTFWDWLHLTVPTGGCHLPGNPAQGTSECQAWPCSTGGSGRAKLLPV